MCVLLYRCEDYFHKSHLCYQITGYNIMLSHRQLHVHHVFIYSNTFSTQCYCIETVV